MTRIQLAKMNSTAVIFCCYMHSHVISKLCVKFSVTENAGVISMSSLLVLDSKYVYQSVQIAVSV